MEIKEGQKYLYGGKSNTIASVSDSHLVLEWTTPVIVDNKFGGDIYGSPYSIIPINKFKRMLESKHPLNPKLIK